MFITARRDRSTVLTCAPLPVPYAATALIKRGAEFRLSGLWMVLHVEV